MERQILQYGKRGGSRRVLKMAMLGLLILVVLGAPLWGFELMNVFVMNMYRKPGPIGPSWGTRVAEVTDKFGDVILKVPGGIGAPSIGSKALAATDGAQNGRGNWAGGETRPGVPERNGSIFNSAVEGGQVGVATALTSGRGGKRAGKVWPIENPAALKRTGLVEDASAGGR